MNIYDIVSIVREPYAKAFSPSNIESGFRVAGIEPFNPDIFTDDDYLGSSVTDRPPPTHAANVAGRPNVENVSEPQTSAAVQEVDRPTSEAINNGQEAADSDHQLASGPSGLPPLTSNQTNIITPEVLKPFPKALPGKITVEIDNKKPEY